MPERPIEIPVDIKAANKTGLALINDVSDALGRARKSIEDVKKEGGIRGLLAERSVDDVEALTDEFTNLSSELARVQNAMRLAAKDGSEAFSELNLEAKELEASLIDVLDAANNLPDKFPSPKGREPVAAESAGRLSSGLAQVGGLASGLGGGQVGELARLGGDIAGTIEQLPRLADGIRGLAGALADAPGLIGSVSSGLTSALIPTLGATGASIVTVAAVAAPLIFILAGIAAVLHGIQVSAEDGKKAAQDYNAELERQVKINRQIADFKASGNLEGFTQAQADFLKQQEDANAELTNLYQKRADLDKQYADLGGQLNANARQAIIASAQETDARIKEIYENQFVPATEALEAMGAAADDVTKAASERRGFEILIDGIRQRIDLEGQYAEIIRSGNVDALAQRKKAIQDELDAIQNNVGALAALAPESEDAATALQEQTDRAAALKSELGYLNDITAETTANINGLAAAQRARVESLTQQVQTEQDIAALIKGASTDALKNRTDALQSEIDSINKVLPELQALAPTSKEAASQLDAYQKRLIAANGQLSELNAALPDIRAAEVAKGLNEIVTAETETDRRIADIRKNGLDALVNIEDAYTDKIQQAGDKRRATISKADADENSQTSKLNKDYMETELKAFEKFRADEIKLAKNANSERLKLLADINESLLDATAANDVVAFIRAKREGEKKLEAQKESTDSASEERKAAFLAERQEATANHEKALQQIKEQAETARQLADEQFKLDQTAAEQARADAITRQKAQEDERIAAEENALLQRIAAIQDNYNLEETLIDDIFAKRKAKYTDDDKIITDRLNLALKRHNEDLNAKSRAELDASARTLTGKTTAEQTASGNTAAFTSRAYGQATIAIGTGLHGLVTSLAVAIAAARSAAASSSFGGGSLSSSVGGNAGGMAGGVAFANEGIVRKPTLAMIGEKLLPGQYEIVARMNPSQGLPKEFGAGAPAGPLINIGTLDLSGSSLTAEDVTDAVHRGFEAALSGAKAARYGNKVNS